MQPQQNSSLKYLPVGIAVAAALAAAAFLLGDSRSLPVISQVRPFQLTNQLGRAVRLDSLGEKVWVANIIFTRCPGPCLRMTQEMEKLVASTGSSESVRFITLTTDPDYDTPDVMGRYARRFQADADRWMFLTGPKSEIARLAIQDLKLTAVETDPGQRSDPNDLFVHSTISVVVDSRGRLRGVVEALEPGGLETLQSMVRTLLKE